MDLGKIDYNKGAPAGYRCAECGATGLKLWRQWNTFAEQIRMLCAKCACEDQKVDYVVDGDGKHPLILSGQNHGTSDQIGLLAPAVPTEEGDTFWGYTSVPDAGVAWWKRLPTKVPFGLVLGPTLDSDQPGGPWKADKPSLLAIASDGSDGVVMFAVGTAAYEIQDVGAILSDLGLDDAPLGVSVWEGKLLGWESGGGYEAVEYNTELKGAFRRPTDAEAIAIGQGRCPWDITEWLATEEEMRPKKNELELL